MSSFRFYIINQVSSQVQVSGLTSLIKLDKLGQRTDVSFEVVEMRVAGAALVGRYTLILYNLWLACLKNTENFLM